MAFMVTVICDKCAITKEFDLVRTALTCASHSVYYPYVRIPCKIVLMSSITSWCSSGGIGGSLYMFCAVAVYPHFPAVLSIFSALCALGEKQFYFDHILRSVDYRLNSQMLSLKIPVCARRVNIFDIIMESGIVWPPALANSLPFS